MAEQIAQDVVKEAKSVGDVSPIDATATTTKLSPAGDGEAVPDSTNAKQPVLPSTSTSNLESAERLMVNGLSADNNAQEDHSALADSKTEPGGMNGDVTREPQVNGEAVELLSPEDVLAQAVSGDASCGSDSDTSRDLAKEGTGAHFRGGAVKKPTAFKAVSVTKNFLAKTASSIPAGRPGDKGGASGQANASVQSLKPRLVAKSGSGIGNSIPRSGLSKMNGAGPGPDASKVWNKNRPVQPPPPKQFTDEELKQQYGIHMATRLQADDNGKEAKWADIDDDEDDWAPEPVEWMDGTKSTVNTTENIPPAPEEVKPAQPMTEKPAETPKPPLPAITTVPKQSNIGGTKTILKPGAHTLTNQTKPGVVSKSGSEKPTLITKSPAPVPAKSPWAPLPPVDKVPPVQINPQPQLPPSTRFSQRDPHSFDALSSGQSQAKEIAADDFNRAWRDDRTNKELYDSKSGRYEPVNELRRGSARDGALRQPSSVLQRPSHPAQSGPAEPSPAFQTSRSSAGDSNWSRRRGSNVSGSSGRRMSFGRPSDLPAPSIDSQNKREPLAVHDAMSPSELSRPGLPPQRTSFPERGTSPANAQHQPWTQRSSPVLNSAQPLSPYGSVGSSGAGEGMVGPPGPTSAGQDPVAIQQQLMREKIERARLEKQRQREEEEREEAAKKERLRKKLEALGPAPEPKQEKPKERSPVRGDAAPKEKPVQTVPPPKPPIPTSDGDVIQYGMIKLHQPHPVKKPIHSPERPLLSEAKPAKATEATSSENSVASKISPSPSKSLEAPQPAFNAVPESVASQNASVDSQRQKAFASPPVADRNPAWKPLVPSDSYPGWSSAMPGQTQSSGNVWGPPLSKDKALGNGTFDVSSRQPPMRPTSASAQQAATAPGPIAPPSSVKGAPVASQAVPNHVSAFDGTRNFTGQSDARVAQPSATQRVTQLSVTKPGPIAPPSKAQHMSQERTGPPYTTADWAALPNKIRQADLESVAQFREQYENERPPEYLPAIKETFKQTAEGASLGSRRVLRTERLVHPQIAPAQEDIRASDHQSSASGQPVASVDQPLSLPLAKLPSQHQHTIQVDDLGSKDIPFSEKAPTVLSTVSSSGRSSRFFPRPSDMPSSQQSAASSASDSPPPPETQNHPAHAGDTGHPVVNLPRPKAKVRLPPVPSSPPKPVAIPARPEPLRVGSRPIVEQTAWQARFNGLFENMKALPSMPTKHVGPTPPVRPHEVTSHTKAPLDVSTQRNSATVSLPAGSSAAREVTVFAIDNGREPVTKATAEEDLLEDREFGSLPRVCVPKEPPMNAPVRSQARPIRYQKAARSVDSLSIDPIDFPEEETTDSPSPAAQRGMAVRICVPVGKRVGPFSGTVKVVPRKRRVEKVPHKKRNHTSREGSNNATSPRSKKPAQNFQGQSAQNNSRASSSGNSGWTSSRTGGHTNPWNKRVVSGVVH